MTSSADTHALRIRADNLAKEAERVRQLADEMDAAVFVQVQFHGHSKRYTYEVAPGPRVEVGQYVAVWSPHSGQTELVRVTGNGRGDWSLRNQGRAHKFAKRIIWHTLDRQVPEVRVGAVSCADDAHAASYLGEY